jgi:putative ABC transport system permease protein
MWWRRRSQRDFEDEIRSHLAIETDRLIAEGMEPSQAAFAARRRFGNVGGAQDRFHDAGPWLWLEQMLLDVRYALRMLRKSPVFTAVAVITLGLGIGASTAVFSVVSAVLLRSLPYREPERLVKIWESLPTAPQIMVSYPDYKDWRVRARVFEDVAVYNPFTSKTLTGGQLPERLAVGLTSANLFDVLGVSPVVGRGFRADDDRDGAERVAMLGSGYWRRQFASDPKVIGRVLSLDGEPYTVIGVLPPTVGLGGFDVWLPVGLFEKSESYGRGNHPGLMGVGRLKPGVTIAEMNADLTRVSREIVAEYPTEASGIGAGGDFFRELMVHNIRPALRVLSWAVLCVLLIVCVNIANLLLGRSTSRSREIALRVAIGANNSRIFRLLLTENLVLALAGGTLGVALAYAGVRTVVAMRPPGIPRVGDIRIDLAVLTFAVTVSIVTGLVFGWLPARHATRVDLNGSLKAGGRGATASGRTLRMGGALMSAEVALALMLLIGSGLLIRSFARLTSVDPGVNAHGVTTGQLNLPAARYPTEERQRLAMTDILRRVQAVPGVASASLSSAVVLSANMQNKITFVGHPRTKGTEPLINVEYISPDFFRTMGMRVVAGRGPQATDVKDAPPVAWIDEALARRYFAGENPVGTQIVHGAFDSTEPKMTIAGVVNAVRERDLSERPLGVIYMPFDQQPLSWMTLSVRTELPFERVMPDVRRTISAFDRELPLANEKTLEGIIDQSIGQEKFIMFVLGVFAAVAIVLAAVGVYGVIAYFVAQRSHEIGIRMALGAARSHIVQLVSSRVLITTGIGIIVGLSAAAVTSGLMTKLLYEVAATDAITYVGSAIGLMMVAVAAAIVPTLRAAGVDPAATMHAD